MAVLNPSFDQDHAADAAHYYIKFLQSDHSHIPSFTQYMESENIIDIDHEVIKEDKNNPWLLSN